MKKEVSLFLLLTVLAVLGNLASVPLLFGTVHIVFGGIFVFVALELLGFVPAFSISILLAVHLFLLWGHPWGGIAFVLEFLVVSLLYKRRGFELITADWLFWLFVGIPVYMVGLKSLLNAEEYMLYLPFKSAVNGLLSTSLASLILLLIYIFLKKQEKVSFKRLVLVSTLALSTIPLFAKTLYDAFHEEEIIAGDVKEDIRMTTYNAEVQLIYWLRVHLNAVDTLATALERLGKGNVEELQRQTEAVNKTFEDFHACYIADENATAITFYPKINPAGRYMIGTNFNYRPYYKKVKETLKPVFTEVFVAKFALRPVVGIAVPAVRNGKFIGYAYCGLNLEYADKLLHRLSSDSNVYLTLVDRNGKIIISSYPAYINFEPFKFREFRVLKEGLVVHIIEKEEGLPLKRWKHAHFFHSDVVGKDVSWKLIAESELAPYRSELLSVLGNHFVVIYALGGISILLASVFSRRIYEPLTHLDEVVRDLTDKIEASPKLTLPKSNIALIDSLTESFRRLAEKIISYTKELRTMAYYDTLTGLPNRVLLIDRIKQAIAFSERHGKKAAVMFIDLDEFKAINDTYGHEVGDELLKMVAQRLSSVFRTTDTVARFGGDEFVAVVAEIDSIKDVIKLAERVLKVLETPFDVRGDELFISASIGISLYPDNGHDASELIKFADAAMYKAKEEGKNKFALFTRELHEKSLEIFVIKNRLHKALENGEFMLYYQPIHTTETGELLGCEALLRWKHPTRGVMSPAYFMEHLEDMGLIKDVGEWVFERACQKAKEWDIGVHVNISPKQLSSKDIVGFLGSAVRNCGVNPELVALEVTENTIIGNYDDALEVLHSVRDMGMKIFVDDFGTGYSSLLYIKNFPLDGIKIDRQFISSMELSRVDRTIVKFAVELAHSLGIITVAEGVEAEFQLAYLKSVGCDALQGYMFSKPLPEEEFKKYMGKFR